MADKYLEELKNINLSPLKEEGVPNRIKFYDKDMFGRPLPHPIPLNEQLAFHLRKIPMHIEAKNDYFGLCIGYSGSGKSHILQRVGLYYNHKFSLDDISFTPQQFDEWVSNAPKGSFGILDEADVMSAGRGDEALKHLIRNSKRIRTKGLVVFMATPTMRDMHHHFAFRAKMVLYTFVPKNTKPDNRGYLHCYHDPDLISSLFARMKKAYSETREVFDNSFSTLKNNYQGRDVVKDWFINEAEYEAKKELARRNDEENKKSNRQVRTDTRRDIAVRLRSLQVKINDTGLNKLTNDDCADILGVGKTQYWEYHSK